MAIAFVKNVVTGGSTSAGTTTLTLATTVAVDNLLILRIAMDNSDSNGANPLVQVTDSKGNTWTEIGTGALADPGAQNAGVGARMFACQVNTAFASSDTISVAYAGNLAQPSAKGISVDEWSGASGPYNVVVANNGTTTTPTVTATTVNASGVLVIGHCAVEGGTADTITVDADTTNGSWNTLTRVGNGTTTSGATTNAQYKIVNASGNQTYNPTLGTTRDNCLQIVTAYPYTRRTITCTVDALLSATPTVIGTMVAIQNAAGAINANNGQGNASSTSIVAPAVTAINATDLLVGFFGVRSTSTGITVASGMTEAYDFDSPGNNNLEIAYIRSVGAGSTGSKTATAQAAGPNVGQLITVAEFATTVTKTHQVDAILLLPRTTHSVDAGTNIARRIQSTSNSNTGTSITATFSTTPVPGDLLIAYAASAAAQALTMSNSGWTNLHSIQADGDFSWWYKWAGASEPTAITVTQLSNSGTAGLLLGIVEYAGVSIFDNKSTRVNFSNSNPGVTTISSSSVSTTTPGLVLGVIGLANWTDDNLADTTSTWTNGFAQAQAINQAGSATSGSVNTFLAEKFTAPSSGTETTTPTWTQRRRWGNFYMASFKAGARLTKTHSVDAQITKIWKIQSGSVTNSQNNNFNLAVTLPSSTSTDTVLIATVMTASTESVTALNSPTAVSGTYTFTSAAPELKWTNGATTYRMQTFYLSGVSGTTLITYRNISGVLVQTLLIVSEWGGMALASPVDTATSGNTTGTTLGVATGAMAVNNELIYSAINHDAATTSITEDTADSFTSLSEEETNDSSHKTGAVQFRTVGNTTSSVTPDWTVGTSSTIYSRVITFKPLNIVRHSTDAYLVRTKTHSVDAYLCARLTKTHSVDAYLSARLTATHSVDSILVGTKIIHSVDAYIVTTKTHSVDAYLKAIRTLTHSVDASLVFQRTKTHNVDSIISGHLGKLANGSSTTSNSSLVITFTDTSIIGDQLFLAVASDNAASSASLPTVTNIVDSAGNIWRFEQLVSSPVATTAGGVVMSIYSSKVSTANQIGDTVTLTFSNTITSKTGIIVGFRGVQATVQSITTDTGTSSNNILMSLFPANPSYVIAFAGIEANSSPGQDVDTTGGSWSSPVTDVANTGTSLTSIWIQNQSKLVVSTPSQQYNLTQLADAVGALFYVDGGYTTRGTLTHSVDAKLIATRTLTHQVDALLTSTSATLTVTHNVDAYLSARLTKTYQVDAALLKTQTKTHLVDAVLRKTQTLTHSVDSVLLKLQILTHLADAVLKATLIRTYTTDAIVVSRLTLIHSVDALLSLTETVIHQVDSVQANRATKAYQTDAVLQQTLIRTHQTDALLLKLQTLTYNVDAVLTNARSVTHQVDALLQATFTRTYLVDAVLQKTQTCVHNVDAHVIDRNATSYFVDAVLKQTQTLTHSVDAYVVRRTQLTYQTDALLRATLTRTHDVDAYVSARLTVSYQVDADLKATFTRTHQTDAVLLKTQTLTHQTDAVLQARFTRTYQTDAILLKTQQLTYQVDAVLQKLQTLTHSVDAVLRKTQTLAHSVDSVLRKIQTLSYSTDAVLKANLAVNHQVDAYLSSLNGTTHQVDAALKATLTRTYSTDAYVVNRFTLTYSTDALLRLTESAQHTTDAVLLKLQTRTHLVDAVLKATLVRTYSTDALLRATNARTYQVDASIKLTTAKTYQVNALLQKTQTITHSVDGVLRNTFIRMYTTEAVLKKTQSVQHSVDAFLVSTKLTYSTDAIVFTLVSLSHSVDTTLVNAHARTHQVDVVLSARLTRTHTVDALIVNVLSPVVTITAELISNISITGAIRPITITGQIIPITFTQQVLPITIFGQIINILIAGQPINIVIVD